MLQEAAAPPIDRQKFFDCLGKLLDLTEEYRLPVRAVQNADGDVSLTFRAPSSTDEGGNPALNALNPRLRMVCRLAALGNCNKTIASQMNITEATVKVHLKSAMRKLGIGHRTQLVALYLDEIRREVKVSSFAVRLTGREEQTAALIAEGKTNKMVALALGATEQTVKVYVKGIMTKIGARNRTEAAVWYQLRERQRAEDAAALAAAPTEANADGGPEADTDEPAEA